MWNMLRRWNFYNWRCKNFWYGPKQELKEVILPMTNREFLALVEKVRMLKKLKEESKLAMMTPMGGLDPYRPKGVVGRNVTLDHQALGVWCFLPTNHKNNHQKNKDVSSVEVLILEEIALNLLVLWDVSIVKENGTMVIDVPTRGNYRDFHITTTITITTRKKRRWPLSNNWEGLCFVKGRSCLFRQFDSRGVFFS